MTLEGEILERLRRLEQRVAALEAAQPPPRYPATLIASLETCPTELARPEPGESARPVVLQHQTQHG